MGAAVAARAHVRGWAEDQLAAKATIPRATTSRIVPAGGPGGAPALMRVAHPRQVPAGPNRISGPGRRQSSSPTERPPTASLDQLGDAGERLRLRGSASRRRARVVRPGGQPRRRRLDSLIERNRIWWTASAYRPWAPWRRLRAATSAPSRLRSQPSRRSGSTCRSRRPATATRRPDARYTMMRCQGGTGVQSRIRA